MGVSSAQERPASLSGLRLGRSPCSPPLPPAETSPGADDLGVGGGHTDRSRDENRVQARFALGAQGRQPTCWMGEKIYKSHV